MDVTKVVGFDIRIPKHFSLHFSDFSTILYEFLKFTDLDSIVFMSFFTLTPELSFLLTRDPWTN